MLELYDYGEQTIQGPIHYPSNPVTVAHQPLTLHDQSHFLDFLLFTAQSGR